MANIGYFKIDDEWIKASELINYEFEDGKYYEIQNRGLLPILMYDGEDMPVGNKMGFIVQPLEVAVYQCKANSDLYMKSLSSKSEFNISEL